MLAGLRQSGDLNSYLSSMGEQGSDRFASLMAQHNNSPEVQKLPYQDRVKALQSRQPKAEDIVQNGMICQPAPD